MTDGKSEFLAAIDYPRTAGVIYWGQDYGDLAAEVADYAQHLVFAKIPFSFVYHDGNTKVLVSDEDWPVAKRIWDMIT